MVRFGDNWACSCCRGARSLSAADSADPVTGLTSSSLDCVRTSTSSSFNSRASRPNLCRSSWFSVINPCDFSLKSLFSIRSFSFSISRSNTCCSSSLILAFFSVTCCLGCYSVLQFPPQRFLLRRQMC